MQGNKKERRGIQRNREEEGMKKEPRKIEKLKGK